MMNITYTRRPLRMRFKARIMAAYYRWLIKHAERDLARHQAEFEHASKHLPAQIKVDREHIHTLTLQLTRAIREL
jgi:hypothetical protein